MIGRIFLFFPQMYDQIPMNQKKTLLPRTHSSQTIESNQESMVEHAPFDIYLCDNCEAELYSLEAYLVMTKFYLQYAPRPYPSCINI